MNLGISTVEGVQVARVGEPKLVFASLRPFRERLAPCVEGESPALVLDLEEVDYVDSAAIGCIMELRHHSADRRGFLGLAALQPRVETMLRMTGAHELIRFFDTVEDAVRAAQEAR